VWLLGRPQPRGAPAAARRPCRPEPRGQPLASRTACRLVHRASAGHTPAQHTACSMQQLCCHAPSQQATQGLGAEHQQGTRLRSTQHAACSSVSLLRHKTWKQNGCCELQWRTRCENIPPIQAGALKHAVCWHSEDSLGTDCAGLHCADLSTISKTIF
jgi:hypothetical protein